MGSEAAIWRQYVQLIARPQVPRKIRRQAALGMNTGDEAQQPLARGADQRIGPPHFLALQRGAQDDVLAGDAAIFRGELRRDLESQRNGILGLCLYLRNAQRVKSQHEIRCI